MSFDSGNTPILDDDAMYELGFTDHRQTSWYLCVSVGQNVTLNITIDKATGNYEELVMDEFFGQPEYYGRMKPEYRDAIRHAVDRRITELCSEGLTVAVDHRLYGCES